MDFSKIVAINGKTGLYEVMAQKNNGLIVKSFIDGRSTFVSINTHAFSLLDSVAIYTYEDSEPLDKLMRTMKEREDELPTPDPKSDKEVLREYLNAILPDHDETRVYPSDIKKLVKWFRLLKEHDAIPKEGELQSEKEEVSTEEDAKGQAED